MHDAGGRARGHRGSARTCLTEAIREIGNSATAIACDLTKLEALPSLIAQAERKVGAVTIVVNNAGVHLKKPALETSDAEFAAVLQTHLLAAFALARESARGMLARTKGSLLFVGSMASLFGLPNVAAYTAAKSAVVGLTRALAVEWSAQGVRVNAILPGWIETDMSRPILEKDPERKATVLSRTPMHRLGSVEDVGWAAVYLCSPAAKFVTGTTLAVDGGVAIGF